MKSKKLNISLKTKLKNKKIAKKIKPVTLDLREKEIEPLKQHGFKEGDIGRENLLFK